MFQKHDKDMFQHSCFQDCLLSLSEVSWTTFRGHLGSCWPVLDPKMGPQFTKNWPTNVVNFLVTCWTSFGTILVAISGGQNQLKQGPAMGPVLEPASSGTQGSPSPKRKINERVEKGKQLELHPEQEREG